MPLQSKKWWKLKFFLRLFSSKRGAGERGPILGFCVQPQVVGYTCGLKGRLSLPWS